MIRPRNSWTTPAPATDPPAPTSSQAHCWPVWTSLYCKSGQLKVNPYIAPKIEGTKIDEDASEPLCKVVELEHKDKLKTIQNLTWYWLQFDNQYIEC